MRFGSLSKLGVLALVAAALFVTTAEHLKTVPRQTVQAEIRVALPLFVQVFMAVGDRFLAANMAAIRSAVVETQKMKPEEFRILGKLQEDVSWLNPAHEDNYYIAAAILPWGGEVDAAQRILKRAAKARYYDYQPAFFYGFNLLHFKGDAVAASTWMRESAEKLPDGNNRVQMQRLAALWMERAQDLNLAINVVDAMAKQAKRKDFRSYLENRAERLRALRNLRQAADVYSRRFGHRPSTLQDIIRSGVIPALPQDPFGFGFAFDGKGRIILRNSPQNP